MTNVYLVRHGQASAGTSNYDRLSDRGIEQARLLGAYWKQCDFHVDAAYHGSLHRQQHTAELALAGIKHSQQTRWRDAPESNEVQSWERFSQQGWNAIQAAVDAHTDNKQNRKDTSVGKKAGKQGNLVFFTSGGIIATVMQQLLSLDFNSTMQSLWQIRNASVTNLLFNSDGIALVDYNTVPHLQVNPQQYDKTLITQI